MVAPRNTVYPGWDGVHHKVHHTFMHTRRFLSSKSHYWQVYGRRTSGDPNMWSNQRSGLNQGPLSHEVAMLPVTPLYNHWNVLLIYWNPRHFFNLFKFLSFLPAENKILSTVFWVTGVRIQETRQSEHGNGSYCVSRIRLSHPLPYTLGNKHTLFELVAGVVPGATFTKKHACRLP